LVIPDKEEVWYDSAAASRTWPTHYERAPEMPPNSRQQPTIATSSNLQT